MPRGLQVEKYGINSRNVPTNTHSGAHLGRANMTSRLLLKVHIHLETNSQKLHISGKPGISLHHASYRIKLRVRQWQLVKYVPIPDGLNCAFQY